MPAALTRRSLWLDFSLFFFSLIFPVAFYLLLTYFFVARPNEFDSVVDGVMMFFKLFWYGGIVLVPTSFVAFLLYGSPLRQNQQNLIQLAEDGWNKELLLNVVYVSKGVNVEALARSATESLALLRRHAIRARIEIVTDLPVANSFPRTEREAIAFVQVPVDYTTPNKALYKARALQYALENRTLDEESTHVFNLHLDEESQLTPEVLAGIHHFLKNPENRTSVGQGEIQYNAYNYGEKKLITAIDSIRTGDDLGRFRFQLKLMHRPLFGLHGSFLFIPQTVEEQIGFDLGGKGSITEDAYFALLAADEGVKFDWIDGHIREQSPFTIRDVLRQRRRWISGLEILAADPLMKLSTRLPLRINLLLWEIAWVSMLITIINIFVGGSYYPAWMSYLAGFLTGGYISLYTIGAYRNLRDLDYSWLYKLYIYWLIFLLVPLAAIIEAVSVIYALLYPMKTFEVVQK